MPSCNGEGGSAPPRLSTYLRAIAKGPFDVEAERKQRSKHSEREYPEWRTSTTSAASLTVESLFGTQSVNIDRDTIAEFLASVRRASGMEATGEELAYAAVAAYEALRDVSDPLFSRSDDIDSEEDANRRRAALRRELTNRRKKALESALGSVDESKVDDIVRAANQLQGAVKHSADPEVTREVPEYGESLGIMFPQSDAMESLLQFPSDESAPTSGGQVQEEDHGKEEGFASGASAVSWLKECCVSSPGESKEDAEDVALGVCQALMTSEGDDAVAAEIFDLLGEKAISMISRLIKSRDVLSKEVSRRIQKMKSDMGVADGDNAPAMTSQVSVKTSKEMHLEKQKKKDARRAKKNAAHGAVEELEWLHSAGIPFSSVLDYDDANEKDDSIIGANIGTDSFSPSGRMALPDGASRAVNQGYEEISVPASGKEPPPVEIIPIDALEDWAQPAFEGFTHLNRIQSQIFPVAFRTNENMLVCAPTGAGKTNIALLTILHEMSVHMQNDSVRSDQFKIVYVAPMKALAAEQAANFQRRLKPLGAKVREYTGDMQLSKRELESTHMLVTTPEKWDVVTRKGGEMSISSIVKLLIIDEVHLLNDERGPVIETLVARTQRQVESSQNMIRIVGLSATLPNPKDVAGFLGVSEASGLFHFDNRFRPIPLHQSFCGVTERNAFARQKKMNEIAYDKALEAIYDQKQAMVFVHSRKETGRTAWALLNVANHRGEAHLFETTGEDSYGQFSKEVSRSRNREVQNLFPHGFGVHHAGMLRSDRSLMERAFSRGILKVLVCTATLAWGINLPAHTVIIKGTQIYDAQQGGFKDLGVLDVQQIFGRAGRPQFDTSGAGVIITEHAKLTKYLAMLTRTVPIESQFTNELPDHLNAEIVLGTVTNVREGVQWLGYTYLARRMWQNPLAYGVDWEELRDDRWLANHRRRLITSAAKSLDRSRMIRFDDKSGHLYITEAGRIASHFYIKQKSIEAFNEHMQPHMSMQEILHMISLSSEFENIAPRDDEIPELEALSRSGSIPYDLKDALATRYGKTCALIQAYISRASFDAFSLVADTNYVSQNVGRICRALFELCVRRGLPSLAESLLTLAKATERRIWPHQHPLRQFETVLNPETLYKLEDRGASLERLQDMSEHEIASLLRLNIALGNKIKSCVAAFPALSISASVQPVTRTVLRVQVSIEADFEWRDNVHGSSQRWLLWVEDQDNEYMYHSETVIMTKKQAKQCPLYVGFTIPIFEPLPAEYYLRLMSQDWLQAEHWHTLDFRNLVLPRQRKQHTELLDLTPLPITALRNPRYEALYEEKFSHFNPVQTQAFHTLYHTDENVLLGAPTGSGKTQISELSVFRVWNAHPGRKVVYIAPLKALVRERVDDWRKNLCEPLGKKLVELTGDHTPDLRALLSADVIVSTPEKWDGISRHWQTRAYVQKVALVIIDEIHLLGAERGPILEVIVSRMRYISSRIGKGVRFIGLSTALANAQDVADWLGIGPAGMFNFRPSVRPVPLEVHIQGFPGKHYCPRMLSMNKPTYAAIRTYSPDKPTLVFVSSRRQTRLTAFDVIAYAAADEIPDAFVKCSEHELKGYVEKATDDNLRHSLQFGVGIHHAGLAEDDRVIVEHLFQSGKIQVLVCTSTLAWGVNFPAHLVVVKGTEYFDGSQRKYVDYPITDILQMMGRAGRPQYDASGTCCIMVHEQKKSFYKKFLYEPFPVESSLPDALPDHVNAEVVSGSLQTKTDVVNYISWTYFYRRLMQNPSYYGLEEMSSNALNNYLSSLVDNVIMKLEDSNCLQFSAEEEILQPLLLGRVASYYYLKHGTAKILSSSLEADSTLEDLLKTLANVDEFTELPVRHNEDQLNADLARKVMEKGGWPVDTRTAESPNTKALILFQAHLLRLDLPLSDYITDTKNVLDQSLRIMQAMVDTMADEGWLRGTLRCINLTQMLVQGRFITDSSLTTLPHLGPDEAMHLEENDYVCLPQLAEAMQRGKEQAKGVVRSTVDASKKVDEIVHVCRRLPLVDVACEVEMRQGDEESVIRINLSKTTYPYSLHNPRAYCPRFPKVKEDGWWLVVGDVENEELLALKRLSCTFSAKATLRVPSDALLVGECRLFLMSDTYIGLDQEINLSRSQGNRWQKAHEEEEEEVDFWADPAYERPSHVLPPWEREGGER